MLTAVLSVATVAGYVTYRLTLGSSDRAQRDQAATVMAPATIDTHEHHDAGMMALPATLPDTILNDLTGTPTALSAFAGRPLLINFWATWCAPCRREIPLLKSFHADDTGIDVVGIAVEQAAPVLEYAEEMQFNYPVLVGPSGPAEGMNVMAGYDNIAGVMPYSVLVAADGAVLATHAGELHAEHLAVFTEAVAALAAGTIDLDAARAQIAAHR